MPLISVLGQSIGYLVFGLAGSLWILLFGRFIGGINARNLFSASAYIAVVSKPEECSKIFAIVGNAWSLGLILGSTLGGVFGQISVDTPAFIAAGYAFLNVILSFFFLPESLPVEKRHSIALSLRNYNPIALIIDMARKPGLGILLLENALFNFAFNGVASTLSCL